MKAAGVALIAIAQAVGQSICNTSTPVVHEGMNHGGLDYTHFAIDSADECQQRCCSDSRCVAFTWTSYQPQGKEGAPCPQGTPCCWLKSSKAGGFVAKTNCTSGEVQQAMVMSPRFTKVSVLADDPTGNLRDPSAMVQDPKTGKWHFWVVYIPGTTKPGWAGYLHHYSADTPEGPFINHGLALNHSSDPAAFDSNGMFSPSALYDEEEDTWFLFYSGTGSNDTTRSDTQHNHISAQLVASAASPDGPWTRLGLVTYPTGSDETGWEQPWNARRCDSGRAMKVDGKRGYYVKCCRNAADGRKKVCSEGAYFPNNPKSWRPPYTEWSNNPIYKADGSGAYVDKNGYENCEFFLGPRDEGSDGQRLMHVVCNGHSGGQPHFVVAPNTTALSWTFVEMLDTKAANEPTPVYQGAMPGDEAEVNHFLARLEGKHLTVGLFKLEWVPQAVQGTSIIA